MCMGGDGGAGAAAQRQADDAKQAAAQAQANEDARQARVKAGQGLINQDFAGFNDDFYNGRAKAYEDFANPQYQDQYDQARRSLIYGLSNQGLLDSSEGARQMGQLQKQADLQKQQIVDTGLGYANQARQQVEQNRSDLMNQLTASSDPDSIAAGTIGRTQSINATPTFSPLVGMFNNVLGAVNNYQSGQQSAQMQNWMQNNIPSYGTSSGKSSSRMVS